jgi:hypothetical protein
MVVHFDWMEGKKLQWNGLETSGYDEKTNKIKTVKLAPRLKTAVKNFCSQCLKNTRNEYGRKDTSGYFSFGVFEFQVFLTVSRLECVEGSGDYEF